MNGLYIHIPFCRKKCNYCDFVSYAGKEEKIDSYLNAAAKEIEFRSLDFNSESLNTIYVGGGTPSVLSAKQLEFLFSAVYDKFDCDNLDEITVESNPESLDEGKLTALKKLKVNRLSIGLQSYNNIHLKVLGRVHNADRFLKIYSVARNTGFNNINIDLIYGIPGQNLSGWRDELSGVTDLSPEHISVYPLTIENNTRFFSGGITIDEDLQAYMYEYTAGYLTARGYKHYEISNFAREKYECVHNKIYWHNKCYMGIGVNAVSYISGVRSRNTNSIDEYVSVVSSGKLPVIEEEKLEGRKKLSERLILGLRLADGIELLPEDGVFIDKLKNLESLGLVENRFRSKWRLTSRGTLLANHVFRELL